MLAEICNDRYSVLKGGKLKFKISSQPNPVAQFAIIRLFVISCLLLFAALPVAAQDNISGVWAADLSTGDGNILRAYLDLKQSGDQLTGAFWYDINRRPITKGTIANGKFHIEFLLWPDNPPPIGICDGVVDGDKLHLKVNILDQVRPTGDATRTTPQALELPARLPLPALHDIPDNGLARLPPMGWSSWNHFNYKIDDAIARATADAMVASGMRDAGYIYLNLDDTWQGPRDAQGNITSNLKFPDMKGLADYIHSKGLKLGLYSSPGPNTCEGYLGSYGHEEQDAKTYAAWGADYFKYDWCSAGRIYQDSDMRAVYQKMSDALRATGRPMVFSLCQYGKDDSWKWGAKVGGNLWRTTGDIIDDWKHMTANGFRTLEIASFAQPGHWNDPDILEIGNGGMTNEEYRTHMSLWSILAAPLLAGNDLRTMNEEIKSILLNTEVIAIDQDPLGLPAKKISDHDNLTAVSRPLKNKTWAVGLFNRGDATAKMSLTWSDLGLHGKLRVRDLWAHKDLGKIADQFSAEVPSHGVVLITVRR
jgi:alpha-galactosidase